MCREILRTLDRLGLADNTLILLSSDNGPVIDDGYQDQAVEKLGDHKPSGPFRGGKYSKFEAGTRVPFVVRWPAKVKPGVSDAIVSQIDLLASFSKLLGVSFDATSAPDSRDVLAALLGESSTGRESVVLQGSAQLALRSGKWKWIEGSNGPAKNANTNTELGNATQPQLYDLESDVGERKNVASQFPDIAKRLQSELDAIRSTP